MKKSILVFSSICSLLISCVIQKDVPVESSGRLEPICGGNFDRDYYERESNFSYRNQYLPDYVVGIEMVVKDGDTLELQKLQCADSIEFTRAFEDIEVNDMCIEMGMQGKTYFSAITNKYGGFEEVQVLKSVDPCFKNLEEKIKKRLLTMRILPKYAGVYEIRFYHIVRLS